MAKGLGIAGLLVSIMAMGCSGAAQYLPRWVKLDTGAAKGKHGVWRTDLDGADPTDWLESLSSSTEKTNAKIIRYTILGGGVFIVFSIVLILVFICGSGKRAAAVVASLFCLLAVGAHTASLVLFHYKFEPTENSEYSYSFYLAIAGGGLSLISGILKIAAAVKSGTKVDDFGRSAKQSSRGYAGNSTRSSNSKSKGNKFAGSQSNRSYGGSQTNRSYGGSQGQRGRRY